MSEREREAEPGGGGDAAGDPGGSLEVWCAGEEWCPVTATASILGRKWHPVIIHRLLEEPMGFNALKRAVDGVSAKVLSNSLEALSDHGLVEREVINEKPFRVEYRLTDRGESLRPVIEEMQAWGRGYLEAPEEA